MREIKIENLKQFSDGEKLRYLVSLAHLAPSSHNIQPWLFRIENQSITILPNHKRKLPASDKNDRQMYLSLGAVSENLRIAAEAYGLKFSQTHPDPSFNHVVTIFEFENLDSESFDEATLNALINRHCNRNNFEAKQIDPDFLNLLKDISNDRIQISVVTGHQEREAITQVVLKSLREAFLDKGFTRELSGWIKPSLMKYQDGMPGYNVGIPWLLSFVMPWMIKNLNLSKQQVKMNEPLLKTSPALVVISSQNDDKLSWIEAGAILDRIAVRAEKKGIKISIFGSVIEIGSNYENLQKILGITGRPLVFFRLGYSSKISKSSPRLEINKVLT